MKVKIITCPACGANIEVKKELEFCYCTYCGAKLEVDKGNRTINVNKNINMNKQTSHTTRYINEAEVIKVHSKEKERKTEKKLSVFLIIILIVVFGLIMKGGEKKSIEQEAKLEALVAEIMIDIENEDFKEAYVKANLLYYTVDYSSEIEEKWDNTREAVLKKIEEAEKANKQENKSSFWDFFD